MKEITFSNTVAIATISISILLSASAISSCSRQPEATPFLTVTRAGLVNSETREPVRLKGVSLNEWTEDEQLFCEESVKEVVKKWGANVIRVPLCSGSPANPSIEFHAIDAIVNAAVEAGCYVILDMNMNVMMDLEDTKEAFKSLSTKYAGIPNVIYEILGSPVSAEFERSGNASDIDDSAAMREYWDKLYWYAASLNNIICDCSKCDPVILVGCPGWNQRIDLVVDNPLPENCNVLYTVNFRAASDGKALRDACDRAIDNHLNVFITDCAACDGGNNGSIDPKSWNEWNEWADGRGISMVASSLSDKDGACSMMTSSADPSSGRFKNSDLTDWGKSVKKWLKGRAL